MSRFVALGEIMARLTAPGHQRLEQALPGSLDVYFAGAEATIAASIARFGGDAAFVTALPAHAIADACVANLRGLGVDTSHLLRPPAGRFGLFFAENGVNQRPTEVIYDRENSSFAITPPEAYDWEAILEGADWLILSGITPAISRNASDVMERTLEEAGRRNIKVACDMNYRAKLWNWEPDLDAPALAARTMQKFVPHADLIVCGREDAENTLALPKGLPIEDLPQQIAEKYPRLQTIAMTRRRSASATQQRFGGLLYDRPSGELHWAPTPDSLYDIPQVVDRFGAGDAFLAALLFAIETEELSAPATAIRFAAAAGCLAHSNLGDFHFSSRAEVETLMEGDTSGRVKR